MAVALQRPTELIMAAKEKEAPALPEGTVEVPKKKYRVKRIVII